MNVARAPRQGESVASAGGGRTSGLKDLLIGLVLRLLFAVLLVDAAVLLWGYHVGLWLWRAEDQRRRTRRRDRRA